MFLDYKAHWSDDQSKSQPHHAAYSRVGHQQPDVLPVVTGHFHRLVEFFYQCFL
jgi:hypothetical protein